jgi:hypothetical protein
MSETAGDADLLAARRADFVRCKSGGCCQQQSRKQRDGNRGKLQRGTWHFHNGIGGKIFLVLIQGY